MKIFLTPASSERHCQHEKLLELWKLSSKKHQLSSTPDEADLIIISDIKGPNWFEDLRRNKAVRHPECCFAISDADYPLPLLHGIYISNQKKLNFKSRFRTGCYALYPEALKNKIIQDASGDAYLHPKKFLYSFIGQDSAAIRQRLFQMTTKRDDIFILNSTQDFNLYAPQGVNKENQLQLYYETILRSKFALCPKGTSPASLRLFEVMKMGVAPVIISDDWVLPKGPHWKEFVVFVPEKKIDALDALLTEKENDFVVMGKKAQEAYTQFFADDVYFDYLVDQMIDIKMNQKIPEYFFWALRDFIVTGWIFQRHWKNFFQKFGATK